MRYLSTFLKILILSTAVVIMQSCNSKKIVEPFLLIYNNPIKISDTVSHCIAKTGLIDIQGPSAGTYNINVLEPLEVPVEFLQDSSDMWSHDYSCTNGYRRKYIVFYPEKSIIVQVFRKDGTIKTHGRYNLILTIKKSLNPKLSNSKRQCYYINYIGKSRRDGEWTHYDENETKIITSNWANGDSLGVK